jgi:dephospho-CoA kinase
MHWKHGRSKPVIGIIGGIGSGKSAIAALFARQGWAVIDSDALAHAVIQSAEVKTELRHWLGATVFDAQGNVVRKYVGELVFADPGKLRRLNEIIHPRVNARRAALMRLHLADPAVRGIVWDTPLLLETGLDRECDAILFVKVPNDLRLSRVAKSRGWSAEELAKREKSQIGLDKKADLADYCIDNGGDEVASLLQVQRVLSHLFSTSRS